MKSKINGEWSQKLIPMITGFIGSLIGGVCVLGVALLLDWLKADTIKSVDAAGLIAAICGLLAALLGIGIVVVFSIQWAFMDDMLNSIKEEIRSENRKDVQGTGEFTLLRLSSWRDIQSYNQAMKRQLERFPANRDDMRIWREDGYKGLPKQRHNAHQNIVRLPEGSLGGIRETASSEFRRVESVMIHYFF